MSLESKAEMPIQATLMNLGRRQILGYATFEMLKACDPTIEEDEVYELIDLFAETHDGKLDDLEEIVITELMAALGNSQAEISRHMKLSKLARQKAKRDANAQIKKAMADLEKETEPPGTGEKSKKQA